MDHDRTPQDQQGRGRESQSPTDIPAQGWKDIFWRSWQGASEKNLFLVAGGVTYSLLLALFPGLVALVSLYGLVSDPGQVERQVAAMSGLLPEQSRQLIGTEMHQIVSSSSGALSVGVIIGVLFALWSASRGMSGMMSALDIAYQQQERRSFIRFNLTALVLTLGLLVTGLVAVALVAGLPALVGGIGLDSVLGWVAVIVEWPLLMVFVVTMLAVLYRFAPDRDPPQWRWITPGAIVATLLWILGSILFSLYVGHFGNYNATYGSLGAVVVLLTWLYLSAFVVLLGAEINAEAERQTRKDTTVGAPEPMGKRGAMAADTVGNSYDRG